MPTVMITGCSSGFGNAIARHFLDEGWSVVATMRTPDESVLPVSDRLRILPLDVSDTASIDAAVRAAGPIDALVNNAGIGAFGPLEGMSDTAIRRIFDTNVHGVFETIRAVLPQMRARGEGTIVNVSSSVTQKPLPLLSVYTASKAAVNAFTECLALELEPLGIRTRTILPGQAPATRFGQTARERLADEGGIPEAYGPFAEKVIAALVDTAGRPVTQVEDVSQAVWRAVTDPDCPFVQPAGADAVANAA